MVTILTKYIIKNFIKSFVVVFLCFFVIISLLELMDVVRQYFSGGYEPSATQMIKITLCRAMVTICTLFSFLILFAIVVFYTTMHNHLEINAIRCAGVSRYKISRALFVAVSILGVLYISIFDTLSVYSYRTQDIKITRRKSADDNLTFTNKGIWFHDVCGDKSYIISVKNFDHIKTSLNKIKLFEFDKNNDLVNIIIAKTTTIKGGIWHMQDCKIITNEGETITKVSYTLNTKLSYKKINKMVADPHSISFWNIRKFTNMLDKAGLSSMHYQMHWFSRISTILQMFAFVVFASAFCVNHNPRNHKQYIKKASALIALAFPLYFLNNLILAYGKNGIIPLPVSSFVVPIFILTAGILFLNED